MSSGTKRTNENEDVADIIDEELDATKISNLLHRPVFSETVPAKKVKTSRVQMEMSDTDLFISNLLAAFKDIELHISLMGQTSSEVAISWADIEASILTQRQSLVELPLGLAKQITLDDLTRVLFVAPDLYTVLYRDDVHNSSLSSSPFPPSATLASSKLFIQTLDTLTSLHASSSGSESVKNERSIGSIITRRKSHFRDMLFSMTSNKDSLAQLLLIDRSHLLSKSLVKLVDATTIGTTSKQVVSSIAKVVGSATGSVSSGMGQTYTTHDSTSPVVAPTAASVLNRPSGLKLPSLRSHNQLIESLYQYTQLKPIEMASPVKAIQASDRAAQTTSSHTGSENRGADKTEDQSSLPVSPLPITAIDSNSNEPMDLDTLRALVIERGKLQKSLQESLSRETEFQRTLNLLNSVIPISDEIQQIFNRINRTSYVLTEVVQLLCNTAAKRSQPDAAHVVQNILVKQAPEYFVIIAKDKICPQSSLRLNFNVKYAQVRAKLQVYVDTEKKTILSKLNELRSS